ncbi:cell division protein FtsQ/DivIB [Francisella philomiragia]|uniref:Cell division FtsQ family protein n=1 Tax=Francisella philomiragia TaxID=28110 RepID=A0AAW3D9I6_9GAMM|nr:cell division protein FtsQ/DivIB [Francisella philomiragia]KFJ42514.1 cell division FtsQ family protein [Francisella philomiragia]MBK2025341.1 cell division protein FtsQ/DivIB [Francisella philomiragia]MBK2092850.1 cell division protein FtsQ/DivIB [Francisella philomiragia]MBK2253889.1 cell division protein FtsQ/DivIB [Francisella philomiragia]MBK2257084.1 cell division protein FtsQ/DivIB [Francisella philomiragia]
MLKIFKKFFILGFIFVIVLGATVFIVSKTDKKISRVDVVSNDGLVYISKQDLIDKIISLNNKQWFDLDIDTVEKYFYNMQGVDYTLVKKVWPSTLVVYIYDHKPVAYWNNNQILLDNMDIITPVVFDYDKNLPYIDSNDDTSKDYIYETLLELNKLAKNNKMQIVKISYRGNQFSVLLSDDIEVVLGSVKLKKRLELFFKSYKDVKNYKSAKYFDMRYSDGFAVKYN